MITEPDNIELIKARARLFWAESDSAFMKVVHATLSTYDDRSVGEALAYVNGKGVELTGLQLGNAVRPVPDDTSAMIGQVRVVVLTRALRHIEPQTWRGFASWIVQGSLGGRIQAAGVAVQTWTQVTMTSDEVLDPHLANNKVVIVCSWSDGALTVYHAHPDTHAYPDHF